MENINIQSMLRVGSTLQLGKYRIERYLSSGGFGNTYVAYNTEFQETVAIKEFFMRGVTERDANNTTVSVSNDENRAQFKEQLEKFKKEARRIRRLRNDHIIAVHDLFEENGTAYYVMDYVDGKSLAERLKHKGGPLDEQEVRDYLPQILDALQVIHAGNIWHLDLKPANIMVDKQGLVRLIDFGASKQVRVGGTATTTSMAYTPGYAPREQMEQNIEKFGPWTDLYALGATIYHLLSGNKPPMPSDIDDEGENAFNFTWPVSDDMKRLIFWLMTTERKQRPQTDIQVIKRVNAIQPIISDVTIIKPSSTVKTSSLSKLEVLKVQGHTPDNQEVQIGTLAKEDPGNGGKVGNPFFSRSKLYVIAAVAVTLIVFVAIISSKKGTVEQATEAVDSAVVDMQNNVEDLVITIAIDGSKAKYTGPIDSQGRPSGYGVARWINDQRYYEGNFSQGMLDGECVKYIDPDGNTFVGTMSADKYESGKMIMKTGEIYEGTMRENAPWNGTLTNLDGSITTFKNGEPI